MAYEVLETCMLVPGFSRAECASWVQAWGSIGAILVTAWAVHRAHRLQQEQKDREQAADYTRFLESLFQLLGGTRGVAMKIIEAERTGEGSTPGARRTMLAELGALADAFKRVDLNRFDRYAYIEAWLVADGVTRKLISIVEYVGLPNFSRMLERGYLEFTAVEAIGLLDVRGRLLYEAIGARGGPPGSPPLPENWAGRPAADH